MKHFIIFLTLIILLGLITSSAALFAFEWKAFGICTGFWACMLFPIAANR